MVIYAGIDYSMTSPAVAICSGKVWNIKRCKFYFLTKSKKFVGSFLEGQIHGELFPPWNSPEERFYNIALWVLKKVKRCSLVGIENYSYGSVGKVFEIGENCGVLKHYLWTYHIPFKVIAPTQVKKLATGKGNASKEEMDTFFKKETKLNIKKILDQSQKSWNPSGDIVDSYFIGKYVNTHKKVV